MKKSLPVPRFGLYILLGIGVLGLICFNMRDLLIGAPIEVSATSDGATLSSPILPISGTARHARTLEINGRQVAVDRAGKFSDEILLSPGYNIVEVALQDQFGKKKVKTYHVVVNPPAAVATTIGSAFQ